MKKKTNKKHFTNADWFSVLLGFVPYFGLTFMGFLLKYDLSMSFVFASLLTALSWGLILLLKCIKGVEDNIKAWRPWEYVILVVILCLFTFAANQPMDRAFSTAFVNNSSLQAAAGNDVKKMNQLFERYECLEEEDIITTKNVLMQYYLYNHNEAFKDCMQARFGKDQLLDKEVTKYIKDCYKQFLGKYLNEDEPNDYDIFKKEYKARIEKIDVAVAEFNFYQIPRLVQSVSNLNIADNGKEIADTLTNLSAYSVDGMPFKFDGEGTSLKHTYKFESEFEAKIQPMLDYDLSPLPMLLSLIVNLIMLFSYFLSYRSAKVEISRRSKKNSSDMLDGTRIFD